MEENNTMEEQIVPPYIPENTDVLAHNEQTERFSGAAWFEHMKTKRITLAGLGGIGSYVCYLIGRMHPDGLIIYDPDTVESVNMAGQMYCNMDIGQSKTKAMSAMLEGYCSYYRVTTFKGKFIQTSPHTNIMICGFDNMEARRDFFSSWKSMVDNASVEEKGKCLLIDGRMSAEELQVFCLTGDNDYRINDYRNNYLFDDSEAPATVCSYKQTSYMATMIGSIIVNLLINFCTNEVNGFSIRDLPFFTYYSGESMFFKTEK